MKTNIFWYQINDINTQLFDRLYKLYDFYNTVMFKFYVDVIYW
jgi:hypothetical protein